MATSIVRGAACVTGKLHAQSAFRTSTRSIKYYVLLPEIPKDTLESNPIMRTDEFPELSKISSAKVVSGVSKLCMEYERDCDKFWTSLEDNPKTFENFLVPFEKLNYPPVTATMVANVLQHLNQTQDYKLAFQRVAGKYGKASAIVRSYKGFYEAVKEINEKNAGLTDSQRAYITALLKDCARDGAELKSKDQNILAEFQNLLNLYTSEFGEVMPKLYLEVKQEVVALLQQAYLNALTKDSWTSRATESYNTLMAHFINSDRKNAAASSTVFNEIVKDPGYVEGMPQSFLHYTSLNRRNPGKGPWQWRLNPFVYRIVMSYCHSRKMRWTMWYANVNVSSPDFVQENVSNHKIIEDIMLNRKGIASTLGYKHFAEIRLSNTMAGRVEDVLSFVEELKDVVYPHAVDEFNALQDYAKERGFKYTLDQWDIPYYRRGLMNLLHKVDHDVMSEYFSFKNVCMSYFNLCEHLFGITVKENKDCDRVHPNVRVYEFYGEKGELLGTIICDYFSRPSKSPDCWVECARERSDVLNVKPCFYVSFDFSPPQFTNQAILLTLRDVKVIYFQLSYALQCLMVKNEFRYQMDYIEGDSVYILSYLMENFLMDPGYLKRLGCHFETGEQLPDSLISNSSNELRYMNAYDTLGELFKSAYDMELNMTHGNWASVYEKLWPLYKLTPFNPDDNIMASDINQFGGDTFYSGSCSAYFHLWAKMVAADIFEAFQEVGLENEAETKILGRRLRDKFLEDAATISAKERFRRFRGRDPNLDALKQSITSSPNSDS